MGNSSNDDSATDGDSSGGDSPPPSIKLYSEGERVLAYYGTRIYEANVEKTEMRKDEWRYFVHYLGWNKSWDEWAGEERLMKLTKQNVAKQRALDRKQGIEKNSKSARSTKSKFKGFSVPSEKKKPKIDLEIERGSASAEKLIKIQIPATLKKQLVDDWDFVSLQDKLVKLPRSPTVDEILTEYLEYRLKKDGMAAGSIAEIFKGIRCYFDKALPVILLYKIEREQYNDMVVDNISPSTIYGAEHLLRLFVKLPEILSYVNIEEETLNHLRRKLLDFLKFLQRNQSTFFLPAYDNTQAPKGKGKGIAE